MTGKNISGDKYMTRQETAEYLKISIRSVDRLIHDKHFDGIQYIGRNVRVHKPTLDNKRQDLTLLTKGVVYDKI